jgi:hypothetical protein
MFVIGLLLRQLHSDWCWHRQHGQTDNLLIDSPVAGLLMQSSHASPKLLCNGGILMCKVVDTFNGNRKSRITFER